jgi:hypothetical protein
MNDTNKTAKTEGDVTSEILSTVMVKETNVTVKMIVSGVGCFNSVCERRHMKTNDSQRNLPLQGRMNRDLTFRAHASYRLGRHLNFSELAQARASHILGQPQRQPFKRFALNIFTEISLILSTTLEVFPASCCD